MERRSGRKPPRSPEVVEMRPRAAVIAGPGSPPAKGIAAGNEGETLAETSTSISHHKTRMARDHEKEEDTGQTGRAAGSEGGLGGPGLNGFTRLQHDHCAVELIQR
jgi:hypothetical protein